MGDKKRVMLLFAAIMALLMIGSSAFACTYFAGRMVVTQGATAAQSFGDPVKDMGFCDGAPFDGGTVTRATNFTASFQNSGSYCSAQLPTGTDYYLYWTNAAGHCMQGYGTLISGSNFGISSGGMGQVTAKLPLTASVGSGKICTQKSNSSAGQEVHVTFA